MDVVAQLEASVIRIIAEHLSLEPSEISTSSRLRDDLAADSLEVAEILLALEGEFEVSIPDAAARQFENVAAVVTFIANQVAFRREAVTGAVAVESTR